MEQKKAHAKQLMSDAELVTLLAQRLGITPNGYDVSRVAALLAAVESARYFSDHMLTAELYKAKRQLLLSCMTTKLPEGLVMEFGVASGRTVNLIAGQTAGPVYGFDSFQGLPEKWRRGFEKGRFAQEQPVVAQNVHLVVGWFSDTLPRFLEEHKEPVSLLHVDCDLYSSTSLVLQALAPRMRAGTIIVFDEYFNYPGWAAHEHKAFMEFAQQHACKYEYTGVVPTSGQVAITIRAISMRG